MLKRSWVGSKAHSEVWQNTELSPTPPNVHVLSCDHRVRSSSGNSGIMMGSDLALSPGDPASIECARYES